MRNPILLRIGKENLAVVQFNDASHLLGNTTPSDDGKDQLRKQLLFIIGCVFFMISVHYIYVLGVKKTFAIFHL